MGWKDDIAADMDNNANLQWEEREHEYFLERKKKRKQLDAFDEIVQSSQDIVDAVENGWIGSPEAYAFFTAVLNNVTEARKAIFNQCRTDLTEKAEYFGLELSTRNAAGRWKFVDAEYLALKERLKAMEEQRKAVFKLGQKGQSAAVIDPETGEIVPPAEFTEGKLTIVASKAPSK